MTRKTIFAVALGLLVAGCAHTPVVPPDKLSCADEPAAPKGAGPQGEVTDEQNGTYLRSLRGAWFDCRSKVDWMRTWVKTANP